MVRRTAIAFASALIGIASHVQASRILRLDGSSIAPSHIDTTVTRLMTAAEVPGVGIAMFRHGRVAYIKAFGFRDAERKLPLTPDTVMTAASFTKVAFAYLCMKLVDEGRLDLDKPVVQFLPKPLPEYPQYADLAGDSRYGRITARMLLSHTSGLPNLRAFEDDRKLHIHFDPGSRYAYSGEGIVLLQRVVETITGQPLETLMQQEVFRPLGMNRTSMVWQSRFDDDFASGYDEYSRSLGPQKRKTADAAGSMQTTLRDFSAFLQNIVTGKGLSTRARDEMLRPQIRIFSMHQFPTLENRNTDENQAIRLSYGLGWGLYWTPYGKAFFKEGHDEGWRNYTVMFDRSGIGILLMTNSGNGEGIFKEVIEKLLANPYTPIEWEGFTPYNELAPRPPLPAHTRVAIDPSLLDKYTGRYGVAPNIIITIRRAGDHLTVQENDEAVQELLPQSATEFFSTVADDVYRFETDAQGRVTKTILLTGGREIPIPRLDEVSH